ncbi:hypothetical protein F4009_19660 [Candidatus Poribacteria bacterium]|nr:hypothetical protein [Candidatus Poribacteria bacterium]MYH84071.1 hypothetical protein [Candidatus Poribacteria bacterium]MYK96183.1 hypothetical protein [Candidatus Poribacteria bacterium]
MKNRFILSHFFYLTSILSLLFCFGCGDTEDEQDVINPAYHTFLDAPDDQSLQADDQPLQLTARLTDIELKEAEQWLHLTLKDWTNLKDEDWEKLKGEDWVRLTDAEVKALMNLKVPPGWGFEEADEALRKKHREAKLFQQFGNIPQLRYMVEFDRTWGGGIVTLERAKQLVADMAAMYFLFPGADNQQSFEKMRNLLQSIIEQGKRSLEKEELRLLEQLRIEDPEAWVKSMRAFFIQKHGDTPEANTIIEFLRKLELNLPRADNECRSYLTAYNAFYTAFKIRSTYEYEYYAMFEAVDQLWPIVAEGPLRTLEKFREARAEGISFYDIDWDDN